MTKLKTMSDAKLDALDQTIMGRVTTIGGPMTRDEIEIHSEWEYREFLRAAAKYDLTIDQVIAQCRQQIEFDDDEDYKHAITTLETAKSEGRSLTEVMRSEHHRDENTITEMVFAVLRMMPETEFAL